MSEGILDGVRIVDFSCGIAGRVAAMLLAECGADVVRVESGKPDDTPGRLTWDRSKRSAAIDVGDSAGAAALRRLLAEADVFIHEKSPQRAAELGLDDAALAELNPALIVCSVLAWPANHPNADLPVDELLAMARLGICDEQMPMRRDGPVFIRFPLGTWGTVYLAAAGIAARLLVRQRTGTGGAAHTSLVQGALVPMGMHWARAENPSEPMALGMPKLGRGSQSSLFECSDGVWVHLMKCPDESPLMSQALLDLGAENVTAANQAAGENAFGYPNRGANIVIMKQRPSAEWLADFWANDIPAQPALPMGDVLADEQARANGYVIEIDDPRAGRITVPGPPMTLTPPQQVQGVAPDPGQHTDEVFRDWATRPRTSRPQASEEASHRQRYPLEGLKVLDLGSYLAGPYAPMLMADLGADVIKLESTRGDAMRPTGWAFAGCQRGKRGVAVDLKSPAARPVVEALIRWADVVHHNMRRPAARKLGIDYDSVKALNPDVVYCHTSSYGPAGPRADWPGYDQLFQAQCGWEVLGAGDGNPPMWHRFGFMDHQCALSSLVATLLALYERNRTGQGQAVAGSLLGAGVLTSSETYRRADGTLAPFATLDGDQTTLSSGSRIVQARDGWIALALAGPDDVASACVALQVADESELTSYIADQAVDETVAKLRAADIMCEPVREQQRDAFFDDPANRAAGLVAEYPHAEWGQLLQPGAMWFFGDLDVRLELAPPALGEHTATVLQEVGFTPAEIAELAEQGALVVRD
jgi:crotonobetainyl-CoA:carnitine CoA-transferase CaiB-like acyl-CoA transferase